MEVIDTSALILARRNPDLARWVVEFGHELALVDVVALEYLMGARTGADYVAIEASLSGFERLVIEPGDWDRARAVHRGLAMVGPGHQRAVRIPDLLIAAVAERTEYAVVHYDEDYDRIAAITGQPTRWVMPRGSAS
jgi:hypothetical protein